jgi:endonuclease III
VDAPSRIERLVGELRQFYGLLPSPPADAFQLFVWEVLSYRSAPGQRNNAFNALKRNRSLTPDSMDKVAPKKLQQSILLTGSYVEQRMRALKAAITVFHRHPGLGAAIGGALPTAYEAVSRLPQMGDDRSPDRMLLYAGGHKVFPMNEGVGRVLRRLGYDDAPVRELPDSVDAYRHACTYLTHHAATTCTDDEPHCGVCPLKSDCPYGRESAETR